MKVVTILGINPGTRFIGLAVLQDKVLIHHQLRSFQGKWSQGKLQSILAAIEDIISRYRVTDIAVKVPDRLPASLGFTQLLGTLNVLCENTVGKPVYYTLSDMKHVLCNDESTFRIKLMHIIVEYYPELLPECGKEEANINKYYYKLFEAVAAAHMLARTP